MERKNAFTIAILVILALILCIGCLPSPKYSEHNGIKPEMLNSSYTLDDFNKEYANFQKQNELVINDQNIQFSIANDIALRTTELSEHEVIPQQFEVQWIENSLEFIDELAGNLYYFDQDKNEIEDVEMVVKHHDRSSALALYKTPNQSVYFFFRSGTFEYVNEESGSISYEDKDLENLGTLDTQKITMKDAEHFADVAVKRLYSNNCNLFAKEFYRGADNKSSESGETGVPFYRFEYAFTLDGVDIIPETISIFQGQKTQIKSDVVQIFINDSGIIRIKATKHEVNNTFTKKAIRPLSVAVESLEAFLENNMLVPAYSIKNITISNFGYIYTPKYNSNPYSSEYLAVPAWQVNLEVYSGSGETMKTVFINAFTCEVYICDSNK
jgi:hypothetical protein